MMPPKHLRIKCKKPMKHRPSMEGAKHCKQCASADETAFLELYADWIEYGLTHEEAMKIAGLNPKGDDE